jgi:UDPglucose--hexose-1-phosphate uridylyltransferase
MNNKKEKSISEFRRDLVNGEWILVSTARQARPFFFKKIKKEKKYSKKNCPFENPQKSGNPDPLLWYPKLKTKELKDWFVQIIPNKYPLLERKDVCARFDLEGIHQKVDAFGFHEVLITRDHDRPLSKLSIEEIGLVLRAYRERYKILEKDECIEYILIFHNQGEMAGASIPHPHSQIVALPITPPDVNKSIEGGKIYFKKFKKCAHCSILEREIKEKERVIYKNKYFITISPYASKVPYESRIFPLKHGSDFEKITDEEISYLAKSLKDILLRLNKVLGDPDYNFFIHTSSVKIKNSLDYHWHIEILPRTYKWAGLELGTGVETVAVSPEATAEQLRKVKIK